MMDMAKELKARSEMDPKYQWHLDHIYATEEDYERAFEEVRQEIETLKGYQGKVAQDPKAPIVANDRLAGRRNKRPAYRR